MSSNLLLCERINPLTMNMRFRIGNCSGEYKVSMKSIDIIFIKCERRSDDIDIAINKFKRRARLAEKSLKIMDIFYPEYKKKLLKYGFSKMFESESIIYHP